MPPAILADEQAKIMNLSSAKTCPFSCHKFQHENSDIKPKPNITKTQKFYKTSPVLACSRKGKNKEFVFVRLMKIQNFLYRRKTCEAKRSRSFTASPGVERARKPSLYFFGTFFVQTKKVRLSAAAILAGEQAKITNFIFRETVPVCAA